MKTIILKIKLQIFLIFLVLNLAAQNFTRENASPFVLNFTTKQYQSHEQNYDVLQAKNGKMYFANFAGILEFDGTKWTKIAMNSGMRVLSLAKNEHGVIFAGGLSDFGFLQHDKFGNLSFVSLADSLKNQDVGRIFKVVCIKNTQYFIEEDKMFIYENKKLSIFKFKSKIRSAFGIKDVLYLFSEDNEFPQNDGLAIFKNKKVAKIPVNFEEKLYDVVDMIELTSDSSIAVITSKQGFYVLKDNSLTPMQILLSDYLKTHGVSSVVKASENFYALGTLSGGMVIVNNSGVVVQIIDKTSDLQSETVNKVFLDAKNSIWLATSDGISKVEINFPIQFFNNITSGLEGEVVDIQEFNNLIFIATTNGLFHLQNDKFQKNSDIKYACTDLLVANNQMFISCSNGIYVLNSNNKLNKTSINEFTFSLLQSKINSNWIYSAHTQACNIIDISKPEIKIVQQINNLLGDVNKMAEYGSHLIFEILPNRIITYDIEKQRIETIQTNEDVITFHLNNFQEDVFFSSEKGLFSIDWKNMRLENYNLMKSDTTSYQQWIGNFIQMSENEFFITNGELRNSYIFTFDAEKQKQNRHTYHTVFKPITDFQVNTFFKDVSTNKLWLGGKEGIVLVNNTLPYNYSNQFKTLITKFSSILADTFFQIENKKGEVLKLNYDFNSLHFEYTLPVFPAKGQILYRYYLQGFDKDTSDWSSTAMKDYTNLPDGNYVFVVEAKNEFGLNAEKATLSFKILTPIFRRWWAILIYILVFIITIKLLFDWRMRASAKEKEALEEIVRERTYEINESKKHIEEQRDIAYKHRKHILDSISYAQKIQEAVLPSDEYVHSILYDHFIMYKPRDIVSGDFYWVKKIDNQVVVVAADCTGHGVPGAFMSLLGSAFLNEIVNEQNIKNSGFILDKLREKVKTSLHQEGKSGEQKDGMDIALTIIDFENLEVLFSGAYNPLYIIRPVETKDEHAYEFFQLKADRQPIGIYMKEIPFSTQTFKIQRGDTLYSFSDGYVDQFGGEIGDKFKAKQFKELLLSIQDKSMKEQKEILERAYIKWKRDLEQIDDVLVFGIKI